MNLTDFSGQRPIPWVKHCYHANRHSRPTLSRLELFCLRCPADTTGEATERNDLLVFKYVAEISVCLGQFHACGGIRQKTMMTSI